jgi:uncharacterized protein YegL
MAENEWTEIVCILDRSGSMGEIQDDTIGGFNAFVDEQREEAGRARISLVLFDNRVEKTWSFVDIENAPRLTREDYFVRGSTALLDALGRSLEAVRSNIESMHTAERPDSVVILVMTDGYENASQEYDVRTVRRMVEMRQADGWEFVFIGADINADQIADSMGMSKGSASGATKDTQGTADVYKRMSRAVSNIRNKRGKGDVSAPLED